MTNKELYENFVKNGKVTMEYSVDPSKTGNYTTYRTISMNGVCKTFVIYNDKVLYTMG